MIDPTIWSDEANKYLVRTIIILTITACWVGLSWRIHWYGKKDNWKRFKKILGLSPPLGEYFMYLNLARTVDFLKFADDLSFIAMVEGNFYEVFRRIHPLLNPDIEVEFREIIERSFEDIEDEDMVLLQEDWEFANESIAAINLQAWYSKLSKPIIGPYVRRRQALVLEDGRPNPDAWLITDKYLLPAIVFKSNEQDLGRPYTGWNAQLRARTRKLEFWSPINPEGYYDVRAGHALDVYFNDSDFLTTWMEKSTDPYSTTYLTKTTLLGWERLYLESDLRQRRSARMKAQVDSALAHPYVQASRKYLSELLQASRKYLFELLRAAFKWLSEEVRVGVMRLSIMVELGVMRLSEAVRVDLPRLVDWAEARLTHLFEHMLAGLRRLSGKVQAVLKRLSEEPRIQAGLKYLLYPRVQAVLMRLIACVQTSFKHLSEDPRVLIGLKFLSDLAKSALKALSKLVQSVLKALSKRAQAYLEYLYEKGQEGWESLSEMVRAGLKFLAEFAEAPVQVSYEYLSETEWFISIKVWVTRLPRMIQWNTPTRALHELKNHENVRWENASLIKWEFNAPMLVISRFTLDTEYLTVWHTSFKNNHIFYLVNHYAKWAYFFYNVELPMIVARAVMSKEGAEETIATMPIGEDVVKLFNSHGPGSWWMSDTKYVSYRNYNSDLKREKKEERIFLDNVLESDDVLTDMGMGLVGPLDFYWEPEHSFEAGQLHRFTHPSQIPPIYGMMFRSIRLSQRMAEPTEILRTGFAAFEVERYTTPGLVEEGYQGGKDHINDDIRLTEDAYFETLRKQNNLRIYWFTGVDIPDSVQRLYKIQSWLWPFVFSLRPRAVIWAKRMYDLFRRHSGG